LYCLLRLAQDPSEEITLEASAYMHRFYFPEHNSLLLINEPLTYDLKKKISVNLDSD